MKNVPSEFDDFPHDSPRYIIQIDIIPYSSRVLNSNIDFNIIGVWSLCRHCAPTSPPLRSHQSSLFFLRTWQPRDIAVAATPQPHVHVYLNPGHRLQQQRGESLAFGYTTPIAFQGLTLPILQPTDMSCIISTRSQPTPQLGAHFILLCFCGVLPRTHPVM